MSANRSLIAVAPCGCIVAAISLSRPRAELERAAYKWTVREHLQVKVVSDEYVRQNFNECPHRAQQSALFGMEDSNE